MLHLYGVYLVNFLYTVRKNISHTFFFVILLYILLNAQLKVLEYII